jgi:VWFA-related protein
VWLDSGLLSELVPTINASFILTHRMVMLCTPNDQILWISKMFNIFVEGLLLIAFLSSVYSQDSNMIASQSHSSANLPEIVAHEEAAVFTTRVNLVEVRVVVRDAHGHTIGDLRADDFQLLDNNKAQVVTRFTVDRAGERLVDRSEVQADITAPNNTQPPLTPATALPTRYVTYVFDDIHLQFSELAVARNAADHVLQSLRPEDRVAVYSASGQTHLQFTDDRTQLRGELDRILPHPLAETGTTSCPNISYYMADLIENRRDIQAMKVAMQDAEDCGSVATQVDIHMYARRELSIGGEENRLFFDSLRDVVRGMAEMPGQRLIILVSPGFMSSDELQMQSDVVQRALHSDIVINTLDARGLYTNLPDASERRSPSAAIAPKMLQYHAAEQATDAEILADFAEATGGTFFHNSNDLKQGFRLLAESPETSYLLGFSPQNLKLDGHYHKLKVTLKRPAIGIINARKGYYAPKGTADASEQAKWAIEDAVFSQEEVRDIPVKLHTQFFKPDENGAKLSIVVRVDLHDVRFRKVDGRNNNDLTVVSVLFDRNGNLVSGNQKVLQLHLMDETLADRLTSGITLKSSFDVKPGSYTLRLVVRDQDGRLTAQSSYVEIP